MRFLGKQELTKNFDRAYKKPTHIVIKVFLYPSYALKKMRDEWER
jgi:hypothetical protein